MTKPDREMTRSAAYAFQLLGVLVLAAGMGLWQVWVGLVALGLGLVMLGMAMELGG